MFDVEIERKLTLFIGSLSLNKLSLRSILAVLIFLRGTTERNDEEQRRTDWVGWLGDWRGSDWLGISPKAN